MLTRVDVFTPKVITPPLVITDGPESADPFQILGIDGLGPVTANINTTGYSSIDGEFYNGSNVGKRNIVLTIRINPDWSLNQSYASLRQNLYQYFMPKNKVTLQFTSTHMEQVTIDGYVESVDPNIFTNDPIMTVSIICPDANFVSTAAQTVYGVTVDDSDFTTVPITYFGTVDNGFIFALVADPDTLEHTDVRLVSTLFDIQTFILSDIGDTADDSTLELDTQQGEKSVVYRNNDGSDVGLVNLLKYVSPGSDWIKLTQGINNFRVVNDTTGLPWFMIYHVKYGGI